jgi:protoporphyrinogen oxidase
MRIAIVGAGPAGLLFAHLAKCRRPNMEMACLWTEYGLDSVIALGGCIDEVFEPNQVHQLSQG